MATAKRAKTGFLTIMLRVAAVLAVIVTITSVFFGQNISGFAQAGTGYAAKTACGCRHLAGRELESCKDDLLDNMWAIWLSEDESERSVTASVPLIASNTATYRDGPGCVSERWGG
ncbi:hypothetical protein [Aurantiacibacter aquimixticola]|uniref:Uncharacterized protein n=1 Tax=Aurantiacibacter aquimixticola TaxID=1958945 RepID=A0A419RUZ8_9SPHN|nr:hypothetical protein [Aurantiacibacter aquimixticola]RJY09617.1 hypothetical protein D6201_09825 [Aurantiacibacter aquimixticola]